jgi:hypothetical protein
MHTIFAVTRHSHTPFCLIQSSAAEAIAWIRQRCLCGTEIIFHRERSTVAARIRHHGHALRLIQARWVNTKLGVEARLDKSKTVCCTPAQNVPGFVVSAWTAEHVLAVA